MAGPVDERKFKVFAELILKANRNAAEETGQLPQRVEGLDQRFTMPVLGLGGGSVDYAAAAQRRREREATAPQREAERQERREAARERVDALMRQLTATISGPSPDPEEEQDNDTEAVDHDVEDEDQIEELEQNVDPIIRLMPPRGPVEEPEPEPEGEPEPDRFESLKSELMQALADSGTASDDELIRELNCSAADYYAVLGELIEAGVVIEDDDGIAVA